MSPSSRPPRSLVTALSGVVRGTELLEWLQVQATGSAMLGKPCPHTLFSGPPEVLTPALAAGIATMCDARLVFRPASSLADLEDLFALLASVKEGDVLHLSQIHQAPMPVLATLGLVLRFHEDGPPSPVVWGAGRRRVDLPPFTLVATTSKPWDLPARLRYSFVIVERLELEGDRHLGAQEADAPLDARLELASLTLALLAEPSTDEAHGRSTWGPPSVGGPVTALLCRARSFWAGEARSRGEDGSQGIVPPDSAPGSRRVADGPHPAEGA